mgnify:CR=1 FL=1
MIPITIFNQNKELYSFFVIFFRYITAEDIPISKKISVNDIISNAIATRPKSFLSK